MPLDTSHVKKPPSSALVGLITKAPSFLTIARMSSQESLSMATPSLFQMTVTLPGKAFASQGNSTFSPS